MMKPPHHGPRLAEITRPGPILRVVDGLFLACGSPFVRAPSTSSRRAEVPAWADAGRTGPSVDAT